MRLSKKATEFQKKEMSKMYRGKEIFKPLNTGWIDEHVACVREWVANIFFYRRGGTTIMIDAGYNYDRLAEKMGWLGIDPASIRHILITHQDTDHVGAVLLTSAGSDPLYRRALRVSMGTAFQVPWAYLPQEGDWQAFLHAHGFLTAAMALREDSLSIADERLNETPRLAIVLGTEGDGLADGTIAGCDYTVRIPMAHGVDSLNVAAASAVAFYQLCSR